MLNMILIVHGCSSLVAAISVSLFNLYLIQKNSVFTIGKIIYLLNCGNAVCSFVETFGQQVVISQPARTLYGGIFDLAGNDKSCHLSRARFKSRGRIENICFAEVSGRTVPYFIFFCDIGNSYYF